MSMIRLAQRQSRSTWAAAAAGAGAGATRRGFAVAAESPTLADVHGVKCATSTSTGSRETAAISVVVKAGARHEPAPGVAHVLKNSLFKSTSKRSAIRVVRETEILGGVLSTELSRENLVLTAQFLKGDEGFFAEVLGDALTRAKFARHEYNEDVLPSVASDYEQAVHDPKTHAFDLAHTLAFRQGLGNSLFASPHTAVEHEHALEFARHAFARPSVIASGVEPATLKSLVADFFVTPDANAAASSSSSSQPSTYHGGEVRVPSTGHSATDHLLVAFKGGSVNQPEFAVLRHLLGGHSSLKWTPGASALSSLARPGLSAHAFNVAYSDAGLLGFWLEGPTNELQSLASGAVAELKKLASGQASAEDLKRAVAKAKFELAALAETRTGQLASLGAQIAAAGDVKTLDDSLAALDAVSTDAIAKAAESALKSKPTTVAYGDTHALPYADQLGL